MARNERLARGWLKIGDDRRMEVWLDARGKLHFDGDGPVEWIDIVLDEYGGVLVFADGGYQPLLPVRPQTFSQFLHAIVNLVNAHTEEGWRYDIEEERVQHWVTTDTVTGEDNPMF